MGKSEIVRERMFSQRPSFRYLAIGAVVSLFVLAFLVLGTGAPSLSSQFNLKTQSRQQYCAPTVNSSAGWEFVVERDGNNHGLSEDQCRIAFPKLFVEIDKSSKVKEDKLVSYKELNSRTVDDGMVRGIIDRGEVSEILTLVDLRASDSNIWYSVIYCRLRPHACYSISSTRHIELPPPRPDSIPRPPPPTQRRVHLHHRRLRRRHNRPKSHLGLLKA